MMVVVVKWLWNGWLSLQQVIQSIWVTLPAACPTSAVRQAPRQQSASVSIKAQWKLLRRKLIRKSHRSCLFHLCVFWAQKIAFHHTLGRRPGGKKCSFMCGYGWALVPGTIVFCFFHLQANSSELNYQTFGPEPRVIQQLGCGIQLLVSSHTFQYCSRRWKRCRWAVSYQCHHWTVLVGRKSSPQSWSKSHKIFREFQGFKCPWNLKAFNLYSLS